MKFKLAIGPMVAVVLCFLWSTLPLPSQTINMGRTYTGPGAVRYANEGGTGTTLNKLAKLTGAPSTAIITATTDTAGIVGVVVAGAGTTGNSDIAVFGKASCVFDSATTAGHYVQNDTSTAGDCMDAGATYPTGSQVIGVVTSTNGGAGTYEVDLSFRESANLGTARAFGASFDGGGAALTAAKTVFTTIPFACEVVAWNISACKTFDAGGECTVAGTATVDVWRVAAGTAVPGSAGSITGVGAGRPVIAANTNIHSVDFTGWASTALVKNDVLGFHLEAVDATYVNFVGECRQ